MAMGKRKLHDSNMIIGDSSMCDLELEEEYINNDPLQKHRCFIEDFCTCEFVETHSSNLGSRLNNLMHQN